MLDNLNMDLKAHYPAGSPTIPALPSTDYLDQVYSVNLKLEGTISDGGVTGEDRVNWYRPVSG